MDIYFKDMPSVRAGHAKAPRDPKVTTKTNLKPRHFTQRLSLKNQNILNQKGSFS